MCIRDRLLLTHAPAQLRAIRGAPRHGAALSQARKPLGEASLTPSGHPKAAATPISHVSRFSAAYAAHCRLCHTSGSVFSPAAENDAARDAAHQPWRGDAAGGRREPGDPRATPLNTGSSFMWPSRRSCRTVPKGPRRCLAAPRRKRSHAECDTIPESWHRRDHEMVPRSACRPRLPKCLSGAQVKILDIVYGLKSFGACPYY